MLKKMLIAAILPLIAGCYVVAPLPGGHLAVGIPPVHYERRVYQNWDIIPGTRIHYTSRYPDIYYYNGYYYRVAGDMWYYGRRYGGPWRVVRTVPSVFLRIPPSHPRYDVVKRHPSFRHYRHRTGRGYQRPPRRGGHTPGVTPGHEPEQGSDADRPTKGKPGVQEKETKETPQRWHRR